MAAAGSRKRHGSGQGMLTTRGVRQQLPSPRLRHRVSSPANRQRAAAQCPSKGLIACICRFQVS